jgi:hypothetical protein
VRAITAVNVSKLVKDQRFSAFSSLNESVPLSARASEEKNPLALKLSDINKFIDPVVASLCKESRLMCKCKNTRNSFAL